MAKKKETFEVFASEGVGIDMKEALTNLLKAKVAGLFDREPQPGMSDSKLSQLVNEIIELLA